jgi:hypothetical protein
MSLYKIHVKEKADETINSLIVIVCTMHEDQIKIYSI